MPIKLLAFLLTIVSIVVGGLCVLATLGWLFGAPEAVGMGYLVPWWLALTAASAVGIWYAKVLLKKAGAGEGASTDSAIDDEITDLSHRPELLKQQKSDDAIASASAEKQEVRIRAAGAAVRRENPAANAKAKEPVKKQSVASQVEDAVEKLADQKAATEMESQDVVITHKYSWTSVFLILINAAVFAWVNVRSGYVVEMLPRDLMIQFGGDASYLTLQGDFWRILTSTFLHWDLAHLVGNMIGLFYAGRYLEYFVGRKSLFMIFVTTGLLSSIGTHLFHGSFVVSAGASGAVFGLYGALLVCFLMSKRARALKQNKSLLIVSAYFVGSNLLRGFGVEGVNNAVHVAGLLSGAAVGFMIYGLNLKGRVGRYQISGLAVTFSLLVLGFLGVNKDFQKEMNSPESNYFLVENVELATILDEGSKLSQQFSDVIKQYANQDGYHALPEKLGPLIVRLEKVQQRLLEVEVNNDRAHQLLEAFIELNHYFLIQARVFSDPASFPNGVADQDLPQDVARQIEFLSVKINDSSKKVQDVMAGKTLAPVERNLASVEPEQQAEMEEIEVSTAATPPQPVTREEIYMSLIQDFVNMDDQLKLLSQQASSANIQPDQLWQQMDVIRGMAHKIEREINTLRPINEVEANLKLKMLTTMGTYRKMLVAFSDKSLFEEGPQSETNRKKTETATREYHQTMPALLQAIERFKQSLASGTAKESVNS